MKLEHDVGWLTRSETQHQQDENVGLHNFIAYVLCQ